MAQDKIAGIMRALVGVPQERLVVVQRVVNNLNSAAEHGDEFQVALSRFVLGWKPTGPTQEVATPLGFELYFHDRQKNGGWIKGFDLKKHLEETGLINRCFSLEDEVVKGWLADASTYPEEFKGKAIFLWKSQQVLGGDPLVAYLIWDGARVLVHWRWLESRWYGDDPALLAP